MTDYQIIYANSTHLIICGDYRTVLPTLPPVDAVITDPPFNAGKGFANDSMTEAQWQSFCEEFSSLIDAPNILVEVNKKDRYMRQALDNYHKYRYAICLNYTNSMRNGTVGFHNWGLVLWYGEGKCHKRYKDRIDSALHSTKKEFSHPSPKEVTHYQKLCEMFCPPGGIILDPFMGSGTTLIGARNLGYRAIGIDISREYCEIAKRRLLDAPSNSR